MFSLSIWSKEIFCATCMHVLKIETRSNNIFFLSFRSKRFMQNAFTKQSTILKVIKRANVQGVRRGGMQLESFGQKDVVIVQKDLFKKI